MNDILYIVLFIGVSTFSIALFVTIIYWIKLLRKKNNILDLRLDSAMLRYVTSLMPWINRQVEKSTEVIFQSYAHLVDIKELERTINEQTQTKIINDIRTHFYGTIPRSLSETLFKYIDQRQVDILILTSYRRMNDGFFTIKSQNNISEMEA